MCACPPKLNHSGINRWLNCFNPSLISLRYGSPPPSPLLYSTQCNFNAFNLFLGSWRHLTPLPFSGRRKDGMRHLSMFFFLNQVDKVHHVLPFKCENAQQSRQNPPSTTVSTPTGVDHTWLLKIEASHTPIISASFSPTFLPPIISSFSTHPSLRARTNQRAEMRSYFFCACGLILNCHLLHGYLRFPGNWIEIKLRIRHW